MRFSTLAVFSAVCLLAAGCNSTSNDLGEAAPAKGEQVAKTDVGDLEVGQPIQVENLTVFPVVSKSPREADRFITLDEGLKAGTVEILEVGAAGGGPDVQTIESPEAPNPPAQSNDSESPESNAESPPSGDNEPAPEAPAPAEPAASGETDPEAAASGALIRDGDFAGLAPAPEAVPEETGAEPTDPDAVIPPDNSATNVGPSPDPSLQFDQSTLDNNQFGFQQLAGGGNDVNKLIVVNRSERPLYLMPGEVIVGGSQDRTIGQELVIAPDGKPTPIDVFCVEHGRWGGRAGGANLDLVEAATMNANNAGSVAVSADLIRADAANPVPQGKFVASVGNVNAKTRQVLQQSADQQMVWDEVAENNAKSGVQVDSGAFTHNYVDAEAVKRFDPFIKKLQKPIAGTKQVVGVIVAIDGKVQSIDVFESTPLFRKLWPKLLKSYALDAVTAGETGKKVEKVGKVEKKKTTCTQADAVAFFNEAAKAGVNRSEEKQSVMLVHRDSDRVVTFSASDPDAAVDLTESGGFSGAIHASAFAK